MTNPLIDCNILKIHLKFKVLNMDYITKMSYIIINNFRILID